jgi:hypothetical protein
MRLKAPAKYWGRKRTGHLVASMCALALFVICVGALVWAIEDRGPELLTRLPKDPSGAISLGSLALITAAEAQDVGSCRRLSTTRAAAS